MWSSGATGCCTCATGFAADREVDGGEDGVASGAGHHGNLPQRARHAGGEQVSPC